MFRTGCHLRIVTNLLQRHTNLHKARFSRYPIINYKVQVRDTCPPKPPPPPPKPKDDKAIWGAMTIVFLAAGFAFIAKQNPEIRDWLTIYAPWFDDLIAVVFEENMSYAEMGQKCLEDVKRSLNKYYTKIIKDDKENKPKPCSMELHGTDEATPTVPTKSEIEDEKGESADAESPTCEEPPPVVVQKTVCEIVDRLRELANDVLSNYYTAVTACSLYNKVVGETMENFSIPTLKELQGHMDERKDLVQSSLKNADEAMADIEELSHYVECGAQGSEEDIEAAKTEIKDFQQKIKASKILYDWENDKSTVLDTQWKKVEALIDKYTDENETMFSEIKYDQDKLSFRSDMDLLLYHTSRYSYQLKKELHEVVLGMTDRVNRAFETLPQDEKDKKQRNAMMQATLKQKRAEMDKNFSKRYEDQRVANDKLLKDSLQNQLEAHHIIEEERLKEKEEEATVKLNKLVSDKVAFEKRLFAQQLKEMSIKLKLVEDKLNARLKAESETRRSQALWAAGSSLLAATKRGDNVVKVDKELDAIEKASGDGDKLVTTVLKAIPNSVREKGLVPESILRDRYREMEKVAMKVALVELEGGPLPVYFMSWLMSLLLFMKIPGIPQEEYDNPQKDPPEDLDTFDLLQRARFWLERGNLAAAVRYVNLLQGASLAAALTWRDAALAHLETRQAAEAVLAHATALGLQYI